ncbi:MAG: hypothetical protein KC496_07120 [Anaerolineae bacterium]|nr:hypothetical protein [Anaerolineae bacterium]
MDVNQLIALLLAFINEILAVGIVIIAASLLLYNLTRNLNNRVARASGVVLACVTSVYLVDAFASLGPDFDALHFVGRLQWVGIAFIPAALFHVADALLATTGLPSRGRRRRIVRLLYMLSAVFFVAALFTNTIAEPYPFDNSVQFLAGSIFPIYLLYFITACIVTFINVNRARERCLTASSARRMAYLQFGILLPALGIFPYSALLPPGEGNTLVVQLLVNTANVVVITMLIFLSYPLSFFGSDIPDRVVKVELLRFLLRGPGTALLALAVLLSTRRATEILGLAGEDFTPFAVVAVVLLWQWSIHVALPILERWLVYGDEDDEQLAKLQDLSARILTRNDLTQLNAATLEGICEYLRTEVAFVVSFMEAEPQLISSIGHWEPTNGEGEATYQELQKLATNFKPGEERLQFQPWKTFQVTPLYSLRVNTDNNSPQLLGLLGVQLEMPPQELVEEEDIETLNTFIERAEQTLDDLVLQGEIFAALEGLLPQISLTRKRAAEVEYRPGHKPGLAGHNIPSREEAYELVRAALRQYWGGPGMTRSRLLDLHIVQNQMTETDSPVQALRNVIEQALNTLRPESPRTMTATEWTMYNIVALRFIEGKKVRDVARRLSVSEPDLYRKQRLAIQAVADALLEMEKNILTHQTPS